MATVKLLSFFLLIWARAPGRPFVPVFWTFAGIKAALRLWSLRRFLHPKFCSRH